MSFGPCRVLRPTLEPYTRGQFAVITKPKKVGALRLAIDDYKGSLVVRSAQFFSHADLLPPWGNPPY